VDVFQCSTTDTKLQKVATRLEHLLFLTVFVYKSV
jgi:hypothetical protein